MSKIDQVKEFMNGAGQQVRNRPTRINPEEAVLRVRLLVEEMFELADAAGVEISVSKEAITARKEDVNQNVKVSFGDLSFSGGLQTKQDVIEIADALTDIEYVNLGAAASWGIDIDRCFDLVQENNMLKVQNGTRDENGKLRKPKNHPKVDLSFNKPE